MLWWFISTGKTTRWNTEGEETHDGKQSLCVKYYIQTWKHDLKQRQGDKVILLFSSSLYPNTQSFCHRIKGKSLLLNFTSIWLFYLHPLQLHTSQAPEQMREPGKGSLKQLQKNCANLKIDASCGYAFSGHSLVLLHFISLHFIQHFGWQLQNHVWRYFSRYGTTTKKTPLRFKICNQNREYVSSTYSCQYYSVKPSISHLLHKRPSRSSSIHHNYFKGNILKAEWHPYFRSHWSPGILLMNSCF